MERLLASDYQKLYDDAQDNLLRVKRHIGERITFLAKEHPKIFVETNWLGSRLRLNAKQFVELGYHGTGYNEDIERCLDAIRKIETKLAKKNKYVQTEINFDNN